VDQRWIPDKENEGQSPLVKLRWGSLHRHTVITDKSQSKSVFTCCKTSSLREGLSAPICFLLCNWVAVNENLCRMHKLYLLPQCSHRGSSVPFCTSRCPFGTYSLSHFLQPCNTEVTLAFPSASVIRCKRGCGTKVTLLSPRMGFLQLTRVHTTVMPSLLI
jgi:hypothetical protein